MNKEFNRRGYYVNLIASKNEREKNRKEYYSENKFSLPAKSSELKNKDEMMQLGNDYYNSGKPLEELDEKIRNHRFFIVGYERAKRLAIIANLDEKEGKARR